MPAARMRMRWTAYAGVSTALAAGVILKALAQRPNFYSAAVYLSQSSANLMILTNLLFVIACSFLLGLQKLLYGNLRPIEVEQLYEKAWFAVTETCLAMTVFRGEIGLTFLAMFFSLLTGKVWGWIGEGRVEVLEQQPPRNPRLFHTRLALSLGLSVAFDLTMLEYVVKQVLRMARPDMMVMFGFEFAVLSITSMSTAIRYAIDLFEIGIVREQKRLRVEEIKKERVQAAVTEFRARHSEQTINLPSGDSPAATTTTPTPTQRTLEQVSQEALNQPVDENDVEVEGWEDKGRYLFYLNLATDFFKLAIYLAFFFILLIFYGLPIHILRDVFLTMRSFMKRISDCLKYRTATRDMNARYPDATAEDIGREDVCIICREEMRPYEPVVVEPGQPQQRPNPVAERMRPKKLPCGHVLHFSCLRSWLERQQICPTCRANVVRPAGAQDTNMGAGVGVGQGNGAQHAPARQGPRVYQFGPLRIGVGAARGNNMFEDLQQQMEGGAAPAAGGQAPNADPNAPQQFGVGLRWARRRQTDDMTAQQHLDALEARIGQDVRQLAQSSRELTILQSMQAELQRVRGMRPGVNQRQAGITMSQPGAAAGLPIPRLAQRRSTTLVADNQQNLLQAGNDRLPAGLTLPEGWTMMPLHPSQQVTHQHLQHQHVPEGQMPVQIQLPPFGPMPMLPQNFQQFPVNMMPQPFQQPPFTMPPQNNAHHDEQPAPTEATGIHGDANIGVQGQPPAHTAQHTEQMRFAGPSWMIPNHDQLHQQIHQQQHEHFLASLRNHAGHDATTTTPNAVPTVSNDTGAQPAPADSSDAANGQQETPGMATNHQQSTSSLPSLPSWGSGATEFGSSEHGNSHANGEQSEPAVNGHNEQEANSSAESSSTSQHKSNQPTVEELIEHPD